MVSSLRILHHSMNFSSKYRVILNCSAYSRQPCHSVFLQIFLKFCMIVTTQYILVFHTASFIHSVACVMIWLRFTSAFCLIVLIYLLLFLHLQTGQTSHISFLKCIIFKIFIFLFQNFNCYFFAVTTLARAYSKSSHLNGFLKSCLF